MLFETCDMGTVKLTAAISKRDDWTVDEWLTHYTERHAPLSASVKAFTRHSARYLQNYAIDRPEVLDFPKYADGRVAVTELWFPGGVPAISAAYCEPDYMKHLRPDELRYCSFDDLVAGIAHEVEIVPCGAYKWGDKKYVHWPFFKIFVYRYRLPEMNPQTFEKAWLDDWAPGFIATSVFKDHAKRYTQSPIILDDVGLPGGVPHDLIDEVSFSTLEDAVKFWTAYREEEAIAQQESKFIDRSKTWIIFAKEHEVIGTVGH